MAKEFKQSELRGATPKKVVFKPKDNDGTPTEIQDPVCNSSNALIVNVGGPVEVVDIPGGLGKAYKFPLLPGDQHTVGTAQLSFSSDSDRGPGVTPLTYVTEIKVVPDDAADFDVEYE